MQSTACESPPMTSVNASSFSSSPGRKSRLGRVHAPMVRHAGSREPPRSAPPTSARARGRTSGNSTSSARVLISSIALRHRLREHVRVLAAQQQHRAAHPIPRVPEEEARRHRHGRATRAIARIEVQAIARVGRCASRGWRGAAVLLVGEVAPVAVRVAQVRLDRVERSRSSRAPPGCAPIACSASIGRKAPTSFMTRRRDRASRLRGEHHAEQPAHRGADPLDLAQLQVREHRVDVGDELAEVVLHRRAATRSRRGRRCRCRSRAPRRRARGRATSKSRALPL